MSLKGKYTPLNLNCLSSFIHNEGLTINPNTLKAVGNYHGSDIVNGTYVPGTLLGSTVANFLTKLPKIFSLAFDHTFPIVASVDMVQGTRYIIKSLGTNSVSDFTLYGAKSNKLGTEFVSSGPGMGNGTLYDMSDAGFIKIATYKKLITMGNSVCSLLGNSPPTEYTRTIPTIESRYGFLGQYAIQGYKEFYINNGSYSDFLNTFNTCISSKNQHNKVIASLAASQTYLDGVYSNMNDLISGDIAGVNSSTFYWGQDLIASGRVIDLASIDKFGQPDNLLRTLSANKAITKALNLALITVGFTPTDIAGLSNGVPATNEQQKSLYAAFNLILNDDLANVLIPINCNTQGLTSLADLLDPKKLFPASYQSLTYPKYNTVKLPTNSKTYFLLYKDGGPNIDDILNLGNKLSNFLPNDLAFVCDGFSKSMMQIKNIKSMNIEKFAQVVANLENVNGLNVNGTNVPTDTATTSRALATVALGSGTDGQYTTSDFFGCMTDFYPFQDLDNSLNDVNSIDLSSLTSVYDSMYTLVNTSSPSDSSLNTLITQANAAIQALYTANTDKLSKANSIYKTLANSLQLEQNARDMALPNGTDNLKTNVQEIYGFIGTLITYALDIDTHQSAATLENISDTANLGGNSLIASMRELRNANRLGLVGGELDNDVEIPTLQLKSKNGLLANMPIINPDGSTTVGPVTTNSGVPDTPGSTGGSSATTLIPDNLNIINLNNAVNSPIVSPNTAVNDVILCNCDCWELLKNNVTY